VDHDSLPYDINTVRDKVVYRQLRESLEEAKTHRLQTKRYTKDVRDSDEAQSLEYTMASRPLCDMDFDAVWQHSSLRLDTAGGGAGVCSPHNYANDVGGLTLNSPNTVSSASQSSTTGVSFRIGETLDGGKDANTVGEAGVSRYQPYFSNSFNSLSQIDSNVMFTEDHVSLPYTVNLQDGNKMTGEFMSIQNYPSQQDPPANDFLSLDTHSKPHDSAAISSEDIDLREKVMKELGEQIQTRRCVEEVPVDTDKRCCSQASFASDDYSPETDYTESSERRAYNFFRDGATPSTGDLITRPVNPEPAELSDYVCTPSPAISIDCSPEGLEGEGIEVTSPPPAQGVGMATKYEEEQPASFSSFYASPREPNTEEVVEEEEAVEEVKASAPSPAVTPGGLPSVRYRMTEERTYTPDWEEESQPEEGSDDDGGTDNCEEESDDSSDSSSSGEFLWTAGDAPGQTRPVAIVEEEEEEEEEEDEDSESGEEEFTPSIWDASRTPTKSLLKPLPSTAEASEDTESPASASAKSPTSTPHKSVHWKRETHHRVYEYPPEPVEPPRGVWGPTVTFPPPPPLWSTQSHDFMHYLPSGDGKYYFSLSCIQMVMGVRSQPL